MEGPAIVWPCGRRRVPELGLQELSTWGVEAAEIVHNSRVVTAQLRHGAVLRKVSRRFASTPQEHLRTAHGEFAKRAYRGNHAIPLFGLVQNQRRNRSIMYSLSRRLRNGARHGRHTYLQRRYVHDQSLCVLYSQSVRPLRLESG